MSITVSPVPGADFFEWVLTCDETATVIRTGHHFTEAKAQAAAEASAARVVRTA